MAPVYPSLVEATEELFDKVVAVNLKGPFRLSALVGARMVAGDGGSMINISSIAAQRPQVHDIPYAAAKAGLNTMTLGLATALGPKVRVNCVMVGPFLTDISKAWDLENFKAFAEKHYPLGRLGEPHEIVGTALYLASDLSSFTTGTVLTVDGGVSVSSPFPSEG
jgi:NAD(P)-dependent dehydrogenase (short-subunit alcohol dehydrogenase family)